jgi:hypothetical protein
MENLKLIRKVKKLSQQKTQREEREKQSTSFYDRFHFYDDIKSLTKES